MDIYERDVVPLWFEHWAEVPMRLEYLKPGNTVLDVACGTGIFTGEKLDVPREADAIYLEEIRQAGMYEEIWHAFAVLLPVQTVGVMGDARTYDYVCALRAVTSTDGMTADFYPFDMDFLDHAASRIINEVLGINRVVYDVTSKPLGTIEWEEFSMANRF